MLLTDVQKVRVLRASGVTPSEIATHLGYTEGEVNAVIAQFIDEPEVNIALDHPAYLPAYSSEEAAGIDLRAKYPGAIKAGDRLLVKTGLSIQLPRGTCGLVCPRSGLALKHGITVLNAPGVVDSDYRGDVGIILANLGKETYSWNEGDRLAQLVVMRHLRIDMYEVERLDDTQRGSGGFGSTGA